MSDNIKIKINIINNSEADLSFLVEAPVCQATGCRNGGQVVLSS